jgi:mannose-6-phosphate isomerase-like protein (cupin superfamily)
MMRTHFRRWLRAGAVVLSIGGAVLAAQQQPPRQRERVSEDGGRLEKVGPTVSRVIPDNTPYDQWLAQAKTRIPVFSGLVIDDVRTVPLKPWTDMGVDGLYVRLADYQIIDGFVLEIPPHGQTKPQRHMFEEGLYFFGGPGHTIIQQEGRRPERVDWKYRSLFAIPLNVKYQHFNDSDKPVRLLAVTSFPFVMNSTNSLKFVYENPFEFRDRYNAQEDFLRKNDHVGPNQTVTNLVPDALAFKLDSYDKRGKNTTNMHWRMSDDTMVDFHVSEMPGGVYKRAHRHTSDAFILLLSGDGYSLTWKEGAEKRTRVDWHEGTVFVPPTYWYHQHLNPGKEPARYLAINAPTLVARLGLRFEDQIEHDPPEIEQEFAREVAKRGGTLIKEK